MKIHLTAAFILFFIPLMILSGCGSDRGQTSSVIASSQTCIDCHSGNSKSISTVTGASITEDWKSSSHNTANGAGCLDCHSSAHYHKIISDCRGCHATVHHNDGTSCSQCHGGSGLSQSDCLRCHATPHSDPNRCGKCHNSIAPADVALKNPDAGGKCFSCHKSTLPSAHFRNMTAGVDVVSSAMYVTRNYEKSCNSCHDPHKGDKGVGVEHQSWAKSGHGNVNGVAWATEDFKESVSCIRCHTATGFINFVTSGYTIPTAIWALPGDKGREVLTCKGCHTSYDYKNSVRQAGAFAVQYNTGTTQSFPNVGESNLCIPCHSGRGDGNTVLLFTNVTTSRSSPRPHYLPAAAVMYMKTGFINFTTLTTAVPTITNSGVINLVGTTYSKTLQPNSTGAGAVPGGVVGGVTSKHRRLGTSEIVYGGVPAETWIPASGVFDTGGPCVTCHVNANVAGMPTANLGTNVGGTYDGNGPYYVGAKLTKRSDSHLFSATSLNAAQQVCNPCHGDEAPLLAFGINGAKLKLEEAKPAFLAGLEVAKKLMETKYNLKVVSNNVSVSIYDLTLDPTGATSVKDWTRGRTLSTANAKKLIGAAFNIKLLYADPGAYVHGRTYTQRLLFDTVDWLDDGIMNRSSAATYTNPTYAATANAVPATNNYLAANADPLVASWLWKLKGFRP